MDGGTPQESLEQMQARHRKEAKDLQGRITNKKKNATKKTRKGVNDECAQMEKQMKDRHADELRGLNGDKDNDDETTIPNGNAQGEVQEEAVLAEKMRAMGVGELGAKPPQNPTEDDDEAGGNGGGTPGTPGTAAAAAGGGTGKKRNRQKERLARRAAEQEAAAMAAEQEAAGMTDHRGAERKRMEDEFARHGLVEHEIRPDGHCLFSAVADQLQQRSIPLGGEGDGEPGYRTVRRRAAGYIGEHGDDYAGFLEEDLESYVRKMRDTAEWGGQIELLAVANVYGVEIHVVQDGQTEVIRPAAGAGGEGEGEDKRIWLAYYRHGYGLGEHYNSLRKKA